MSADNSTLSLWSLTKSKHPEVTGETDQVFEKPSRESILKWMKAGNLAGLVGVDFNGQLV